MDIRQLFDPQNKLKPVGTLSAEQAAAIAAIEMGKSGRGVKKLRLLSKQAALDALGKYLGLNIAPEPDPPPFGPTFIMPPGTKVAME